MLKQVAICALSLLIIPLYAEGQANKASRIQDRENPAKQTGSAPVEKDIGAASQPEAEQHVEENVKVISLPAKDWEDKAAFWVNLALAVVGFLGIGVGVCTLIFLRRQVEEMRRQANLMKIQAAHMEAQTKELAQQSQNMVTAERAWIVETITFLDEIPRRLTSGGGVVTAKITLENVGKQPALLKFLQLRFHATEKLADQPEFRINTAFPNGYILPPGGKLFGRALLEEGSFDDDQIARINGLFGYRPLYLYIYGNLAYESVGVRGANLFCYKWRNLMGFSLEGDKPGFEKSGPDGYNGHT